MRPAFPPNPSAVTLTRMENKSPFEPQKAEDWREWRERLGLTQVDLVAISGVSESTIQKAERTGEIGAKSRRRLVAALTVIESGETPELLEMSPEAVRGIAQDLLALRRSTEVLLTDAVSRIAQLEERVRTLEASASRLESQP